MGGGGGVVDVVAMVRRVCLCDGLIWAGDGDGAGDGDRLDGGVIVNGDDS